MPVYQLRPKSDGLTPLCVDLDGTLLRSDSLIEMAIAFLHRHPTQILGLIAAFFQGRSQLKAFLAERVELKISSLPWREDLLTYLKTERHKGRPLYLVTGANEKFAQAVAQELQLFDGVIGSTASENLIGEVKAKRLIERFGQRHFEYIGDSKTDLPVWQEAKACGVVGSSTFCRSVSSHFSVSQSFVSTSPFRNLLPLVRAHQWTKNALLFLPALLAFRFGDLSVIMKSALAAFSFSCIASSVYILNDLLDLASDREHPEKRKRPLAAGTVSIPFAIGTALVLQLLSGVSGAFLGSAFVSLIALYFAINVVYSVWAKQLLFFDVGVLSGFYTLRLMAGATATAIPLSEWLFFFSLFFFTSLALMKRISEIHHMKTSAKSSNKRRAYEPRDLTALVAIAAGSGFATLVVLGLYLQSDFARSLYRRPELLRFLFPVFAYWISRLLLIANRGELTSDPVVFALMDRATWVIAGFALVILVCARTGMVL